MSEAQKKVINRLEKIDMISLGLSQYTRDQVDDCLDIASNITGHMPRFEETLGSKCYRISTVLDIMSPEHEEDIVILNEIVSLFRKWKRQIEEIGKI